MKTDSGCNAMTQLSEVITTIQDLPYFQGSQEIDLRLYTSKQLERLDLMAGLAQNAVDRLLRLRVVMARELHDRDHNQMYGEPYIMERYRDEEDDEKTGETIHLVDGADLIEEHETGRWFFRQHSKEINTPFEGMLRESVSFDDEAEAREAWPNGVTWEEWR